MEAHLHYVKFYEYKMQCSFGIFHFTEMSGLYTRGVELEMLFGTQKRGCHLKEASLKRLA